MASSFFQSSTFHFMFMECNPSLSKFYFAFYYVHKTQEREKGPVRVVVVDPERTGIPQPVQLVEMEDEFVVKEVEEAVAVVFLV